MSGEDRIVRLLGRIEAGEQVRALVENPAVMDFFARLECGIVDELLECAPTDHDERLALATSLRALRELRTGMILAVKAGDRAQEKLEADRKASDNE